MTTDFVKNILSNIEGIGLNCSLLDHIHKQDTNNELVEVSLGSNNIITFVFDSSEEKMRIYNTKNDEYVYPLKRDCIPTELDGIFRRNHNDFKARVFVGRSVYTNFYKKSTPLTTDENIKEHSSYKESYNENYSKSRKKAKPYQGVKSSKSYKDSDRNSSYENFSFNFNDVVHERTRYKKERSAPVDVMSSEQKEKLNKFSKANTEPTVDKSQVNSLFKDKKDHFNMNTQKKDATNNTSSSGSSVKENTRSRFNFSRNPEIRGYLTNLLTKIYNNEDYSDLTNNPVYGKIVNEVENFKRSTDSIVISQRDKVISLVVGNIIRIKRL